MTRKVAMSGLLNAAIMATLASELNKIGVDVVDAADAAPEPGPQPYWTDSGKPSRTPTSHGPQRKGRRGKAKRW